MRKKSLLLLLSIFFSIGPLFAESVPEAAGWVNDFAGKISPEYREKLDYLIAELEQATSTEIAVVTMASIAPYDEKEYARLLFDKWKPGKRNKDNGVLILVAIRERRWRIETGYGLEGILPDGRCGQIGREFMVPYFKRGEFGEGLYYGVAQIAQIISVDSNVQLGSLKGVSLKKGKKEIPLFLYFFVLFFFFAWNLPWPFLIGFSFTLLFASVFYSLSPVLGILVMVGYAAAMIVRYNYWSNLPPEERKSFFGTQTYGGTFSSGGFGGSGGGGFGGFGGGGGGGGGAGGGF